MKFALMLVIAALLAGCGGGGGVEEAVAELESKSDLTCAHIGWTVFVGEREKVYECATGDTLTDEVLGVVGGTTIGCYVYVDGPASDVTDALGEDFDYGCRWQRGIEP